jgi:hypothetical protein
MENFDEVASINQVSTFKTTRRSNAGGFTDSPFYSMDLDAYWTVKGVDDEKKGREFYECGTSHRKISKQVEDDPVMVSTRHAIFFRGPPPSAEDVRLRLTRFSQ